MRDFFFDKLHFYFFCFIKQNIIVMTVATTLADIMLKKIKPLVHSARTAAITVSIHICAIINVDGCFLR